MSKPGFKIERASFTANEPFFYKMHVNGIKNVDHMGFKDIDRDGIVDYGELVLCKKDTCVDGDQKFIEKYGPTIQEAVAEFHKKLPDEIDKFRNDYVRTGGNMNVNGGIFSAPLSDVNEDGRYDYVKFRTSDGCDLRISSAVENERGAALVFGKTDSKDSVERPTFHLVIPWLVITTDDAINVYMDRLNLKVDK